MSKLPLLEVILWTKFEFFASRHNNKDFLECFATHNYHNWPRITGKKLKGSLTLASLRRLIYLARKSLVNLADLSIRKSLVYLPHKILPASNLVL